MIWALRSLGTSLELAPIAADVLRRYGEQPDFGADDPDLHFGEIGVLLVAHLVGVPGLEERLRARIRGNIRNEAWELMSGSAGSILAARVAGFDAEADESAAVLVAEWDRDDRSLDADARRASASVPRPGARTGGQRPRAARLPLRRRAARARRAAPAARSARRGRARELAAQSRRHPHDGCSGATAARASSRRSAT